MALLRKITTKISYKFVCSAELSLRGQFYLINNFLSSLAQGKTLCMCGFMFNRILHEFSLAVRKRLLDQYDSTLGTRNRIHSKNTS